MSVIHRKIMDRIALLERELEELRIAEKVCRSLNGDALPIDHDPPSKAKLDLKGSTVIRAAKDILSKASEPLHYRNVFQEAVERGYKGRKSTGEPQTFWAIMNRNPEIFESKGDGMFALKEVSA
jgi:hypothetical protein